VTPNSMLQNFGALPGEPGSATYDPNAALPSLGNEAHRLRRPPAHPTPASTRQASAPARVWIPVPAVRRAGHAGQHLSPRVFRL
jgi:hypothetical protein